MIRIMTIAMGAALALAVLLGDGRALAADCSTPVTDVSLYGSSVAPTGGDQVYTAVAAPGDATLPITYTWSPPPQSGQGTESATYRWTAAGLLTVFVRAENCGGSATTSQPVMVYTTLAPDLAITKAALPVAVAGERITYTLSVINQGATPAADLLITDTLPAGAAYLEGGLLVGSSVRWYLPSLAGFGSSAQVTYTVSAGTTLLNDDYAALSGELRVTGTTAVETTLVDDYVQLDQNVGGELSAGTSDSRIHVTLDAASVDAPLTVALLQLVQPTYALPDSMPFAGRAFRLSGIPTRTQPLAAPMAVELAYTSIATGNRLNLAHWDGQRWRTQGTACFHDPTAQTVTCTVAQPALTEYSLFESSGGRVYLPHLD